MAATSLSHNAKNINAKITYLARNELYEREKPYSADFPVDNVSGAKITNHTFETVDVLVEDARNSTTSFSLVQHGFCFLRGVTTDPSELAAGEPAAIEQYYAELEEVIERNFPEYTRVEAIDHLIRKRSKDFPLQAGKKVSDAQPAALPHSDFTTHGAFLRMQLSCPGQERYYQDKEFDMLNVWRVLKGPNNDWPLALLEDKSVNIDQDAVANDVIHRSDIGENWLLHASSRHKWHYLSDQTSDDLIVFRNANSRNRRARAFHAAFDTGVEQAEPRESVEVRLVCFY